MHVLTCFVLLAWHSSVSSSQRYADRNPLPMDTLPFDDAYDYENTESYDFSEDKDIYRWNVEEFPNPQKDYRFCNRMRPSFVCDPDQVLAKGDADKLDKFIMELYNETICICQECKTRSGGIIVGIALLKHMFQPYNQHLVRTVRIFAESIRRNWNLGPCDNDIIIVIATTDRVSYTDVGKATSSYVSLKEAHTIFLENKAKFTMGQFYEGLRDMLAGYHQKTRDMRLPVEKELNLGLISGSIIGAIVLLGIILFLAFVIYKYCRRNDKDPEKGSDESDHKGEGVSSSWTKQVLFGSTKSANKNQTLSAKYQPCETEDKELNSNNFKIDDEIIDTTLAVAVSPNETQLTTTTSVDTSASSEMLEKELTAAVDGIAETFRPKGKYTGLQTDL